MAKQLNVSLAFTANTNEAIAQVKALQKELNGLATGVDLKNSGVSQITPEIRKAMTAAGELQAKLESAVNLKTGKLDLGKFNDSLKKGGVSLQEYANRLDALGPAGQKAFNNLAQSILKAEAPLVRCNGKLREFGTTLANTARWQISSSMLHGFLGTIQSAVGYAQDLNESLNNIRIVTGYSTDKMAEFAQEANKAARALSTTTTAYTNASLIYYQQGLSTQEVKERTDVTIKLANVSRTSVEEASNQMTAIWNNFAKSGEDLERYADVLTKLGAATASSTAEIAGGLEKFASVADMIGLSFDYASSALATITATTRQSEEVVGTALKTIFARIQGLNLGETLDDGTTLNKYSDALNKVGISIFDQAGELKNMDSILDEMGSKWNTLNKDQQVALAQTVAGVRQYNQLVSLMDNWDFMQSNVALAQNASGELDNQQNIYAEGWEAARDRVTAAAEDIYNKLLDDDFFIGFLNGLADAIEGVSNLIDKLGGLQGVLMIIGTLVTRIFQDQLVKGMHNIAYTMKQLTPGGRRETENRKAEVIEALKQRTSSATGATGQAENAALQHEAEMQEKLLKNAKRLSEEDLKQLQIQMDLVRAMDKRATEAGKIADAAKKENDEIQSRNRATAKLSARKAAGTAASDKIYNNLIQGKTASGDKTFGKDTKERKTVQRILDKAKSSVAKQNIAEGTEGYDDAVREAFMKGMKEAAESKSNDVARELGKSVKLELSKAMDEAGKSAASNMDDTQRQIATAAKASAQNDDLVNFTNSLHTTTKNAKGETVNKNQKELIQIYTQLKTKIDATKASVSKLDEEMINADMGDSALGEALKKLNDISTKMNGFEKEVEEGTVDTEKLAEALREVVKNIQAIENADGASPIGATAAAFGDKVATDANEEVPGANFDYERTLQEEALMQDAANARGAGADTVKDFDESMEKAAGGTNDWATSIANASSLIMGLGATISSVQSAIDVFNNPDATTWDKLSSILGIVLATMPLLSSAFSIFGTTAAAAGTAAGAGMTAAMGPIGWIMLAVVGLTAAFVALADAAYKASPEGQFKAAQKAAEQARDAAEQVRNEYDELVRTLDELETGADKIKKLEEGTLEWRKAILDSNNSLIELLNTYGMLDKKNFTVDSNGLMTITDDAKEQLLEEQMKEVERASAAQYAMDVQVANTKTRVSASDVADELTLWRSSGDSVYDAAGSNSQLSANIGMAIGEAISSGRLDQTDLGNQEKLAKVLETVTGLYGEEAKVLAGQIAASTDLQTAFGQLGAEVAANAEKTRILNNQIADTYFGDKIATSGLDAQGQAQLTDMMGAGVAELAEKLYQDTYRDKGALGGGITDADIQKQYAEAMGWATDTIDNQSGNKAKYYAKDGKEIGVISDEVARRYIAQQKAIEQMGGDVNSYIESLQDLIKTGNDIGKSISDVEEEAEAASAAIGGALGTFAGGNGGDLSSLTGEQLKVLDDNISAYDATSDSFMIGDTKIDAEYAKKLGYDSVQLYYDSIQSAIESTEEALDPEKLAEGMSSKFGEFNIAGDAFTELVKNVDLSGMTAAGKEAFANAYSQIFEQGGSDALGMVDKLIQASDDKADEVAALIGSTDWTNWESAEGFAEQMRKLGVEIDDVDLEAFVKEMEGIYGVQKDFNMTEFREGFAETMKIAQNLKLGDIISAEEFEKLGEGADNYFTQMADGTYKLTGDAQAFYDLVSRQQRAELRDTIASNTERNEELAAQQKLAKDAVGDTGLEDIGKLNRWVEDGKGYYNAGTFEDQMAFIKAMGTANENEMAAWMADFNDDGMLATETLEQMAEAASEAQLAYNGLQDQIDANNEALEAAELAYFTSARSLDELQTSAKELGDYSYNNYSQALISLASQYENCTAEVEAYNQALLTGTVEEIKAAEAQLNTGIIVGEAAKKYGLSAEELEYQAKMLQQVHPELELTAEQAARLAIENQRMNKGVADLNKNWKDWKKTLTTTAKDTSDYAKTAVALTKTIADLVGASDDLELSLDFFDAESGNLELLEQAAEGSEKAINALGIAVGKDLVSGLEQVNTYLQDSNGDTLFYMSAYGFTTAKDTILSGLTELETAVLNSSATMGKSLGDILGEEDAANWVSALNDMALATNMSVDDMNAMLGSIGMTAKVTVTDVPQKVKVPVYRTEEIPDPKNPYARESKTWQVRTEEMDGVIQVAQIDTGDNPGQPDISHVKYTGNGSVSPSSTTSNKSGGSSSKKSVNRYEEEFNEFQEIEDKLDDLSRAYSKAGKLKDQAFGKNKLKYIDQEIEALDDLIDNQKIYIQNLKDARDEAFTNAKTGIAQYGFTRDEKGNLTNYEEITRAKYDAYKNAVNKYNEKDSHSEQEEKEMEKIEEEYNKFKELLQIYMDYNSKWEEEQEKLLDWQIDKISKELEKITIKVDSEVELNQRDLDKLDYIVEELNRGLHNAIEIISVLGEQVGKYENQSIALRNGIDEIKAKAAAEDRDLTDEEQRQIYDYEDQLLDINRSLYDLMDTVDNTVMEEFEKFNEEIDENISRFDTYNEALDYYSSIITLSGRATQDSALLMSIATQKVDTSMNKLNSSYDKYLANVEAQKDALAHLNAATTEEDKAYWQKQYDELTKAVETSHNEVLGSWEEVLQAASDKFDLAVQQTLETLKSGISEYGLDGLADRYEKATEEQERYLSNLDKEYELNKLSREIAKSIDETDNIHAKQELNKLLEEINAKQESGVQMSEYDLEIMQKQYDVEMAKLALEEARNAKSTVRLRKDNEGNFGYVYTADQDKIDDAEQNYEDKLHDLQKVSEDYIKEMSDMIIQNEQDMIDALESIDKTRFATKEEYEAEVARITKYYLDKDLYLRQELDKAVVASGQTYGDTILGQMENATSWQEAHETLKTNTNAASQSMSDAWVSWKDTTTTAMTTVGTSADGFTTTITTDLTTIGTATTTLASDIDTQTTNMETHIQGVMDKVAAFRKQYIDDIQAMIDKNKEWTGIDGSKLTTETPGDDDVTPPPTTPPPTEPEVKEPEPEPQKPSLAVGQSVTVKTTATHFTRDGGNGTKMKSFVPGGTYTVMKIEGNEVRIGRNGVVTGWVKKSDLEGFFTGGYTGEWGPEGKLAMLHEKELVLNKDDTANLLSSIDLLHNIISQIDLMAASHSIFNGLMSPSYSGGRDILEQEVHIEAHFPNATNHSEIEEAFGNLINLASQYANRK